IEAHHAPYIGAMALAAVEERAAAMRIAVAGAAIGIEVRRARGVVAGGAAHRAMAAIERKQRLRVIERRHVAESGRLMAARAVAAELIAVARRVAGGAADLAGERPQPLAIGAVALRAGDAAVRAREHEAGE